MTISGGPRFLDGPDVNGALRLPRAIPTCESGIHLGIWKNSSCDSCTTYGVVGYGYVSVHGSRLRAPYPQGRTWQGLRTHAKPPTLSHWAMTPHSRSTRAPRRSCAGPPRRSPKAPTTRAQQFLVGIFVFVPMLALAGRDSVRVGLGPELARRRDRGGLLLDLGARHHRRLPPVLHPQLVQGQDRPSGRDGGRGQHGHGGPGRHLGRGPPAAPQVQRQGGRPALALEVRR